MLGPSSDGNANPKTLRVAVVGFGRMGILHSAILNALPAIKVVAVCETSRFARRLLHNIRNDLQIVSSVAELRSADLDAVYVTTPISSHLHVLRALLENNVAENVFVEKTLGANYEESLAACRIFPAGHAGMVGFQRRFAVTFRKGKELLDQGVIGQALSFNGYIFSSDIMTRRKGWRFTTKAGGGALRDLGSHLIDILQWYFGNLRIVSASERSLFSEEAEDYVAFELQTGKGVTGQLEVCWSNPEYRLPELALTINGTTGYLRTTDDIVELGHRGSEIRIWYRHDLTDQVPIMLAQPEYTRESEHFIACVRERREPQNDFRTAAEIDHVIDSVHERAKQIEIVTNA